MTHPRFAERRLAVEDQSQRRRMRRLKVLAGLILAVLAIGGSTQTALFDIDEVRVIGARLQTPDGIRETAAVELGRPVLGFDEEEVNERVLALPEIKDAKTTSRWSGVVPIEVSERRPIARVESPDGMIVVAEDGVVLDIVADPVPDDVTALTEIAGAMFVTEIGNEVPEVLKDSLAVANELPEDLAQVTERVELSVDSLVLRVIGGGQISLGDSRNLDDKFAAVRAFLTQVDLRCLNTLNVAAPTVPVIERNENC